MADGQAQAQIQAAMPPPGDGQPPPAPPGQAGGDRAQDGDGGAPPNPQAQAQQPPPPPNLPGQAQQPPLQAGADLLERLTDALVRIGERDRAPQRGAYKAPKFYGTGDVEYFLDQFMEVADANGWNEDWDTNTLTGKSQGRCQGLWAECHTRRGGGSAPGSFRHDPKRGQS